MASIFTFFGLMLSTLLALVLHEKLISKRRIWLWRVSRLLSAFLAFVLALFLLQRQILYIPNSSARHLTAGDRWLVSDTKDGLHLQHAFHPPNDATKPVVIVMHGNGGNADDWGIYRDALVGAGYGVVMLEYRGYGGNPGRPSEIGLYADAESVLTALEQQNYPLHRIVIWAHSLGTGVGVEMARRHAIAGLILEAPYTSTVAVARRRFWFLPLDWLMWDQFRSDQKIGKIEAPILIIHGTDDRVIPFKMGEALAKIAPIGSKFTAIPGGGHEDLLVNGGWTDVLLFLKNLRYSER